MEEQDIKKLGLRNSADQENIRSDQYQRIYANNVGIKVTNWEMSLVFGEIIGVNEEDHPIVEQKIKINMTREFTKAVMNLLTVNIAAYEERYGEIGFDAVFDNDEANKKIQSQKPTRKKLKAT